MEQAQGWDPVLALGTIEEATGALATVWPHSFPWYQGGL